MPNSFLDQLHNAIEIEQNNKPLKKKYQFDSGGNFIIFAFTVGLVLLGYTMLSITLINQVHWVLGIVLACGAFIGALSVTIFTIMFTEMIIETISTPYWNAQNNQRKLKRQNAQIIIDNLVKDQPDDVKDVLLSSEDIGRKSRGLRNVSPHSDDAIRLRIVETIQRNQLMDTYFSTLFEFVQLNRRHSDEVLKSIAPHFTLDHLEPLVTLVHDTRGRMQFECLTALVDLSHRETLSEAQVGWVKETLWAIQDTDMTKASELAANELVSHYLSQDEIANALHHKSNALKKAVALSQLQSSVIDFDNPDAFEVEREMHVDMGVIRPDERLANYALGQMKHLQANLDTNNSNSAIRIVEELRAIAYKASWWEDEMGGSLLSYVDGYDGSVYTPTFLASHEVLKQLTISDTVNILVDDANSKNKSLSESAWNTLDSYDEETVIEHLIERGTIALLARHTDVRINDDLKMIVKVLRRYLKDEQQYWDRVASRQSRALMLYMIDNRESSIWRSHLDKKSKPRRKISSDRDTRFVIPNSNLSTENNEFVPIPVHIIEALLACLNDDSVYSSKGKYEYNRPFKSYAVLSEKYSFNDETIQQRAMSMLEMLPIRYYKQLHGYLDNPAYPSDKIQQILKTLIDKSEDVEFIISMIEEQFAISGIDDHLLASLTGRLYQLKPESTPSILFDILEAGFPYFLTSGRPGHMPKKSNTKGYSWNNWNDVSSPKSDPSLNVIANAVWTMHEPPEDIELRFAYFVCRGAIPDLFGQSALNDEQEMMQTRLNAFVEDETLSIYVRIFAIQCLNRWNKGANDERFWTLAQQTDSNMLRVKVLSEIENSNVIDPDILFELVKTDKSNALIDIACRHFESLKYAKARQFLIEKLEVELTLAKSKRWRGEDRYSRWGQIKHDTTHGNIIAKTLRAMGGDGGEELIKNWNSLIESNRRVRRHSFGSYGRG